MRIYLKLVHWLGLLCCCGLFVSCDNPLVTPTPIGSDLVEPISSQTPARTPSQAPATLVAPASQHPQPLHIDPTDQQTGDPVSMSISGGTNKNATASNFAGQICSPLTGTPPDELPQIISEPYHPPPPGREERHQGVDFSYYRRGDRLSILGAGVQSVFPGVVTLALEDKFPYGNMVIVESPLKALPGDLIKQLGLDQDESVYTLYAHLEETPLVKVGKPLEACQALGRVGKSGNAGVAHLHLEMRIGPAGSVFESMSYYTQEATLEEKASYLRWRTSGEFNHFNPMVALIP